MPRFLQLSFCCISQDKIKIGLFFFFIMFFHGCQNPKQIEKLQLQVDSLNALLTRYEKTGHLMQSVLWYQHAPEVQALYYQAFNNAKTALDDNLRNKSDNSKKNAVIVDIDETIFNNSLFQGWLLANNNTFSNDTWTLWVLDTLATPLAGAADFLNYAKNKNCEVFYVSNRSHENHFEATIQNLKKHDLPFADEDHLLLKTKSDTTYEGRTSKEKRRNQIAANFNILLLIGDQLADFTEAFDVYSNATSSQISDSVTKFQDAFGSKFIIMPNPIYCDWLGHILFGNESKSLSLKEFDSLRYYSILQW